uniref:Uncharacterized protein n=1 Tax=Aegilops tauschii TaxID=37682 RepID=M8AN10_AEGTA
MRRRALRGKGQGKGKGRGGDKKDVAEKDVESVVQLEEEHVELEDVAQDGAHDLGAGDDANSDADEGEMEKEVEGLLIASHCCICIKMPPRNNHLFIFSNLIYNNHPFIAVLKCTRNNHMFIFSNLIYNNHPFMEVLKSTKCGAVPIGSLGDLF